MHFIITFAEGRLQGGVARVSTCPTGKHKIQALEGGGGIFPSGGPFLLVLGAIFPMWTPLFSLCGEVLGLSPPTKIYAGTHAFTARVVPNMLPWGNLREIATFNLLIHFRAHVHIILRKSMIWNDLKMFNGKDSDMLVVIVGQYCSA